MGTGQVCNSFPQGAFVQSQHLCGAIDQGDKKVAGTKASDARLQLPAWRFHPELSTEGDTIMEVRLSPVTHPCPRDETIRLAALHS